MNLQVKKLSQLLENQYNVSINLEGNIEYLRKLLDKASDIKNKIVSESIFNSYHSNRKYSKYLLIESLIGELIRLKMVERTLPNLKAPIVPAKEMPHRIPKEKHYYVQFSPAPGAKWTTVDKSKIGFKTKEEAESLYQQLQSKLSRTGVQGGYRIKKF